MYGSKIDIVIIDDIATADFKEALVGWVQQLSILYFELNKLQVLEQSSMWLHHSQGKSLYARC